MILTKSTKVSQIYLYHLVVTESHHHPLTIKLCRDILDVEAFQVVTRCVEKGYIKIGQRFVRLS